MGTWGTGAFDNDAALDWLSDFAEKPNLDRLFAALQDESGLNDDEAVAAAGVVAALCRRSRFDLNAAPDELSEVLNDPSLIVNSIMIESALKAIDRISSDSELKNRWGEVPDDAFIDWKKSLENIRRLLQSEPKG